MKTNSKISGDLAVSCGITGAGRVDMLSDARVRGNLSVEGWLDAPNLRHPCKGLFATVSDLEAAYPRPRRGWWAMVGDTLPAEIFTGVGGVWTSTGQTGGEPTVALDIYDRRIGDLTDSVTTAQAGVETASSRIDVLEEEISGVGDRIDSAVAGITHPVEVVDGASADLILAATVDQPIATFAGGHIRTANFDSSAVASSISAVRQDIPGIVTKAIDSYMEGYVGSGTLPLEGVRIAILGDSISTFSGYNPQGYATFYPQGDIVSVDQTWWRQVAEATGASVSVNASWSGSTVCGDSSSTDNAYAGCSTARVAQLSASGTTPDIVIIWIGINDWGDHDYPVGDFSDKSEFPDEGTLSSFADAYALMVKKVQESCQRARVCCCTLLDVKDFYTNIPDKTYPRLSPRGTTVIDYNRAIRRVCGITGATLIDTHSAGVNYHNAARYLIDGLHPNAAGAAKIAHFITKSLCNL